MIGSLVKVKVVWTDGAMPTPQTWLKKICCIARITLPQSLKNSLSLIASDLMSMAMATEDNVFNG